MEQMKVLSETKIMCISYGLGSLRNFRIEAILHYFVFLQES